MKFLAIIALVMAAAIGCDSDERSMASSLEYSLLGFFQASLTALIGDKEYLGICGPVETGVEGLRAGPPGTTVTVYLSKDDLYRRAVEMSVDDSPKVLLRNSAIWLNQACTEFRAALDLTDLNHVKTVRAKGLAPGSTLAQRDAMDRLSDQWRHRMRPALYWAGESCEMLNAYDDVSSKANPGCMNDIWYVVKYQHEGWSGPTRGGYPSVIGE